MAHNFNNKVVVITGASQGIGAGLAKYFAVHGADVVIAARSLEGLKAVAAEIGDNSKVLIHKADVTQRADHEALLAAALKKFGKVSVWINNAGATTFKAFEDIQESDLDNMINVNTKSVLFGTQTAIKHFKQHSTSAETAGVVINVSSVLGRVPFYSAGAAYNASKHAVNSLTTNARVDMQNQGFKHIHVLLFSPGQVFTDIGKNAIGGPPPGFDASSNHNPYAQTVSEVSEVVGAMVASPEVSSDVYSRPAYKNLVLGYLGAEDVRAVERLPPWAPAPAAAVDTSPTSTAN